ncbi:HAD-IA family hydrolase [Candidatus Dependentiae bacterium]|nr:HAD-IA family hydrolase [Candidatus Dependentiae bacterium]
MHVSKKFLFCLLLMTSTTCFGKTIIWDVGDTLFTTSKLGVAYSIGFTHFIAYMLLDWRNPNIYPIIFDILEKMDPSDSYPHEKATDFKGNPLPIVMHKWLAGKIEEKELLVSINDYLEKLDAQHYFVSEREKNLLKRAFEVMFNPQILARYTYPLAKGIQLLRDCAEAKDTNGELKNTLMILSNWDAVSFNLVQQHYPDIFNYFNTHHIVISGAIGLIKPHVAAFEYIINTCKLNPADCIFIDDQSVNVRAAATCGITGILLVNGNYTALREQLKELNVL